MKRETLMIPAVLLAAALATSIAAAGSVSGGFKKGLCTPDVEGALATLGVDPAKVAEQQRETLVSVGEDKIVTGYRVWLRSNACTGTVAVNFGTQCRLIDTFARGDCGLGDFTR